jgi:hypothetical protein
MTYTITGSGDHRVTSDGVNCTFIQDLSWLCCHMASSIIKLPNTENIETLLIGFFEFYSSCDFSNHAVSLINGMSLPKPDHSPLYIANPLERGFNVSKNMSHGKGKAVPLQAWSGPEGSRKLRFPYFMTTAQDGDKFVSLTHRLPLPPGNTPGTHFC